MKRWMFICAMIPLTLAACDDDTVGPETTPVQVAFTTANLAQSASPASPAARQQTLVVTGSNGTLALTDIRLIVAEFQLRHVERVDDCDASGTGNPCREFEADPFFVDLPLETGVVPVVTDRIPAGTFDALEFEVEDIELDEPGENDLEIEEVAQQVRSAFPSWPEEATMVVVGTFTPTGGDPVPFTVFFDAEIKVELDLVPALVITGDGPSRTITVALDPGMWFRNADDTVVDLSAFDFDATGDAADFELDIEGDLEDGIEADLDGADE